MHPGDTSTPRPHRSLALAVALAIASLALLLAVAFFPPLLRVGLGALILLVAALLVLLVRARKSASAAVVEECERTLARAWAGFASANAAAPRSPEEFARLAKDQSAALAERLRVLESLIAAVDVAAIGIDSGGRVWIANDAAGELFGAGLVDRDIEEIFTQPDIVALAAAARRGTARRARVRLARAPAAAILDISAHPLSSPASESAAFAAPSLDADTSPGPRRFGAVLTFRDVTELATAVQLKTDFVANASHELRTPLAAIRASVETIQDAAGDDPEARARFLRTIASATTRLEDLCRDLMDLSRVETAEASVEPADITAKALALDLTEHFESACAERSLTLCFEIDPRAAGLRSDPRLLSLILRNLIENSTKFAFEKTPIRVRFTPAPSDPRDLVIEVIDQGIGIPIGLQARIFERFFQADPARAGNGKRGTGLGLAIVKHAVRALGGTISVNSVWKQGTTMRVELPDALPPTAT